MIPASRSEAVLQPARSSDVDEHARRLVGWRQDYSQLSPGRFDGTVLQASLGSVALLQERTNQRLRERFVVPAGELVVAVPIELSGPAHWGDARLDADAIAVCRGGEPTDLLTPNVFGIVGFAIPATGPAVDALEPGVPRVLRDRGCADAMRALFAQGLAAARRGSARDGRVEVGHGQDHGDGDGDPVRARFAGLLADEVGGVAARIASGGEGTVEVPALARRLSLVRRAEAFVEAHGDAHDPAAPTVAELCRATGACRRTLQASFVDVLGIGPSRYLRALRLNRVRADLKRDAASVSEVAVRWGFWHLGRFSADYRAMFGELPSETRARARGPGPQSRAADFG
ncbi:MAG: helix-turn-helix domain-containing protein [Burkholderiales bacterium]|nr:MAG: helix-turn-helix domain-containing protein [Burkholderiales bacterium]